MWYLLISAFSLKASSSNLSGIAQQAEIYLNFRFGFSFLIFFKVFGEGISILVIPALIAAISISFLIFPLGLIHPNEISVVGKIILVKVTIFAISKGVGCSNLIFECFGGIRAIRTIRDGLIPDSLKNYL